MEMTGSGGAAMQEAGAGQAYAMVQPVRQQLIGVKTEEVQARSLETAIRAVGRVEYDEQRVAHVHLRISGWVEDLFVDYTGQFVRKGEPLFTLYSQDLVSTQEEFLLALRAREKVKDSPLDEVHRQADQLVKAAHDRLRLWMLADEQIAELARLGVPQTYVTIRSPITGHVIQKTVFKGMFVQPDTRLYTIADLSRVWVHAEVYEYEAPFITVGQRATASLAYFPGQRFHGRVTYIYPYLNKETRTVMVRLELPNPELRLKPDMYADVEIRVARGSRLAIPAEAVMHTGTRPLAFVLRGPGLFEPRTVTLGPRVGAYYEVLEGLIEGETVVTSGNFLIDSESKLMAATSMMGPLGMGGIKMEQATMGEMEMGGMEMGMPQSPSEATRPAAQLEKTADGVKIVLSTEPASPRIGENVIRVTLTDQTGKPVAGAAVRLTYTMPMPGMIPATVTMDHKGNGLYEVKANLGMGGQWDLTVAIQRPGRPDLKETFSVVAGAGGGKTGMH